MALDQRFFDSWSPRALAALRLVAAFLYLQHGTAKLFHVPHVAEFDSLNALSLIGFAGVLEITGSLLLLLGLFTRPVAFILAGEMAVAYFRVHIHMGPWAFPLLNGGEITVLYCFFFLYLVVAGAGPFSLDGAMRHKA